MSSWASNLHKANSATPGRFTSSSNIPNSVAPPHSSLHRLPVDRPRERRCRGVACHWSDGSRGRVPCLLHGMGGCRSRGRKRRCALLHGLDSCQHHCWPAVHIFLDEVCRCRGYLVGFPPASIPDPVTQHVAIAALTIVASASPCLAWLATTVAAATLGAPPPLP